MNKTKLRNWIVALILLSIAGVVFSQYYAEHSEPFQKAVTLVRTSQEVRMVTGDVIDVKLKFLEFSIRYTGATGSAEFNTLVSGTAASVPLAISMRKSLGEWQVLAAKMNGRDVRL